MKVAHRDDYDTHAIIGGKEIQEFGISTSAEFFSILSDQIYTNKPLAVIREVLCNAWDAQIVAGTTHIPVQIKIDEDRLSIRDFGLGIPHELIHQIYCVYGNSTKENDGNQTGGFGLGSKSPFAYGHHFTVNNMHDGLKTVHAISRGSALTQGKPDRRVMVSVPTKETGVEVVIPVKTRSDMNLFIEIAKDIAAFGEMNVEINGKKVEIVPVSSGENNMFITTRKPRGTNAVLNIRYGNVVYPVQPDPEYIGVYMALKKIMEDIPSQGGRGTNDFCLIIQAPANSISVTPSRESLQTTETTVKTIRKLFKELADHMTLGNALFEEKLLGEQAKAIDFMWQNGFEDRIMFSENLLTDERGPKSISEIIGVTQITNMTELADYYLRNKPKINDRILHKMEVQRVQMQIAKGFRHKHFLKRYANMQAKYFTGQGQVVFKEEILRPLVRHIAKHPVLNIKQMNIVVPAARSRRYGETDYGWTNLADFMPTRNHYLKLLQGVIVVTHSRKAYQEDLYGFLTRDQRLMYPNSMPRMVYVAPRSKGHKEAAIELFKKLGYRVIDLATMVDEYNALHSEPKDPSQKAVKLSTRKKNEGLVLLSTNLTPKGGFMMSNHLAEGTPRSKDFEYVIKPYDLSGKHYGKKMFFPWGNQMACELVSLFGSKIGICVNDTQMASQKAKAKRDGLTFIAEQIAQKVLTSASIRRYVENEKGLNNTSHRFDMLQEMAKRSSIIANLFQIPDVKTEDDLVYYEIFKAMTENYRYGHKVRPEDGSWDQSLWDAYQEIKKWDKTQIFVDLEETIKKSKTLGFLDLYEMNEMLKDMDPVNPDYGIKVFIEISIINALKN